VIAYSIYSHLSRKNLLGNGFQEKRQFFSPKFGENSYHIEPGATSGHCEKTPKINPNLFFLSFQKLPLYLHPVGIRSHATRMKTRFSGTDLRLVAADRLLQSVGQAVRAHPRRSVAARAAVNSGAGKLPLVGSSPSVENSSLLY
jgi:hypothetical protein